MLAARPSTIPGRRHKMVFVDFSNPYLRHFLATQYLPTHRDHLERIRHQLPRWLEQSAAAEVAAAATEGRPPRPLAAVLDIDEVILANIHMNSFAAPAGAQGAEPIDFHACDYYVTPEGAPWPRDDLRLNPLLPGAELLLRALRDRGVAIYLITGRLEDIRDETVENLIRVGLAGPPASGAIWSPEELGAGGGRLLMCPLAAKPAPGGSIRPFKEGERRRIEATHRIAVNIGDQVSDLGLYGDAQVLVSHPFYSTP